MKKRMLVNIMASAAILVGCSVLLYPTVSNYLSQKNSTVAISRYDERADEMKEEEKQEILQEAEAYNAAVSQEGVRGDPFSGQNSRDQDPYWDILTLDDSGLMGYIRIPRIHVELPIYHGTSEGVLQRGAGHWKGSSLPIGGKGTHAVLTGHRGLPTRDLFSDLDQLELGDVFYIGVLDETLAYQVDQIQTVLPYETESLSAVEGEDYVTLVTCTPYAVNTHRLLVRGSRIAYEEAVKMEPDTITLKVWMPLEIRALLAVLSVLAAVYIIFRLVRRKKI